MLGLNAGAQEIHTAYLPFEKVNWTGEALQIKAELMTPPLIDSSKFVEHIQSDCQEFKETLNRYQVDTLKPEDLEELLTLPLGYTMKKTYQVKLSLVKVLTNSLNETLQIRLNGLASTKLNISLSEDSLTGATHSPQLLALNPELIEQAGSYEIKFNSRDQLCDFIDNKLAVKMKFNSSVQSLAAGDLKKNLQLFADSVNKLNQVSDKSKAVQLGLMMQSFFENNKQIIETDFMNYDYFWNLLFRSENSFAKTNLWSSGEGLSLDLNQFFVQKPQEIKIEAAL